jgi:hypothetical protein
MHTDELTRTTAGIHYMSQCNAIGESWFFGEIRNRLGVRFPHIKGESRPQVVTADVTRLYTHIPHDDLIRTIHLIIDTVFDHQNQPLLRGPRTALLGNTYLPPQILTSGYLTIAFPSGRHIIAHNAKRMCMSSLATPSRQ